MKKLHVEAKKDFLQSITSATPTNALAELIWNGFDACSDKVQVFLGLNSAGGIENIRVRDFGTGIDPLKAEELFGGLGDSWKKHTQRVQGRNLHGKNGKGRFKSFSLGELVEWNTTFKNKAGELENFVIRGHINGIDNFEASDPVPVTSQATGTEVTIYNVLADFRSLKQDESSLALAKIFAPYLTEYPSLVLEFDGTRVDPQSVKSHEESYNLGDVELPNGNKVEVKISVVEWNIKSEREIHLCDSTGVSLHALSATGIRAPGFSFSVYIKSNHFRELDQTNNLILEGLDPEINAILKKARSTVRQHFHNRILENKSQVVQKWKEDEIYPFEDKPTLDSVELAERQVFDILAVNVQSYLPNFDAYDQKSKKFTFKLLAQAVKDNPSSVQSILSEVLGLKKSEQDELADLLRNTSLSSIISAAKVVTNRLDFLLGLENLLFDKDTRKTLLERDQLHKILERESWLFGEEYALAGSELRLEEVLNTHIALLGDRMDLPEEHDKLDSDNLRVDLMFHKAVQPRPNEFDYLVVELKRPRKKIDLDVILQVKKYAFAVATDPRFNGIKVRWTFVAVSNELDPLAEQEANQRNRQYGQVFDGDNYTIWVKPWGEVISDARTKLGFFSDQLRYEANRDSSKEYLQRAHSHFIPESLLPSSLVNSEPGEDSYDE